MINLIEVIIRLDYWKRWPQCFAFRKSIQIYDSLSVPISKLWDHIWLWSRKKWSRSQGRDRGVSSRDENVKTRRMEDSSIVIDSLWWISPTQKNWQDWCLKCTRYKCSWIGFFWTVFQIWLCPLQRGMFRLFPDENRLWTSKLERSRRRFPESPDFSSSELWSPCRPELEHARLVNPLYES